MGRMTEDSGERLYRIWLTIYGFMLGIIATFAAGLLAFNPTRVFAVLFVVFWSAEYFRKRGKISLADAGLISICLLIGYGIFVLVKSIFFWIIS